MANHSQTILQRTFYDDKGHLAVWQWPNIPLYGWLISKIIALVAGHSRWHAGFSQLSMAFLFTWAFLEITTGINYFRRALGLFVLSGIVVSYFR